MHASRSVSSFLFSFIRMCECVYSVRSGVMQKDIWISFNVCCSPVHTLRLQLRTRGRTLTVDDCNNNSVFLPSSPLKINKLCWKNFAELCNLSVTVRNHMNVFISFWLYNMFIQPVPAGVPSSHPCMNPPTPSSPPALCKSALTVTELSMSVTSRDGCDSQLFFWFFC